MVALLLCDLDDTLVNQQDVFELWAGDLVDSVGGDGALYEWVLAEDDRRRRPREEFFGVLKRRFALTGSVEELERQWEQDLSARYFLAPEVAAALARARETGWRLAVVTNGSSQLQRSKIEVTGLADLVDGICVSEELGVAKPDPRIFELAAAACGVSLSDGWMIGDNPVADIQGAYGVGLSSVWVRHPGERWPPELPPPTAACSNGAEAISRATQAESHPRER